MSPTGEHRVPSPRSSSAWRRARTALAGVAVGALSLAVAGGDAAGEAVPGRAADDGAADTISTAGPGGIALAQPAYGPFIGPVLGGPVLGATGALPVDALPPAVDPAAIVSGVLAPGALVGPGSVAPGSSLGIPAVALMAYQRAAQGARPGCGITWPLLASIGRIESGHASGGRVDAAGNTLGRILGPRLDGAPGIAAIGDSDGGVLDGDRVWDRAVGPMQFIPTTWRSYRADGNGDGAADPHNIHDATVAAAAYLCAGGGNLADPAALSAAVFRYNRSDSYVRTVISWAQAYATGVRPTDSLPGPVPAPTDRVGTPAPPTTEALPPGVSPEVRAFLPPSAPLPPGPLPPADLPPPTGTLLPPTSGAEVPTPTPTPTPLPMTPEPTPSPIPTPSPDPTPTPTPTPSATPSPAVTPTPAATPSPIPTPSPGPSSVSTPDPTPPPAASTPAGTTPPAAAAPSATPSGATPVPAPPP